jgi:hypothetical protein
MKAPILEKRHPEGAPPKSSARLAISPIWEAQMILLGAIEVE